MTLDRALETARRKGLDPKPYFRLAGIRQIPSSWANQRIPNSLFAHFLYWAALETGDPAFGLQVGADFTLGDLGALGYFLMHAPSVSAGLLASEKWFAYQQDGGFFRTRRYGADLELLYDGGELPEGPRRQDAECGLAIIAGLFRRSSGAHPHEVRTRDQQHVVGDVLRSHFGCRILYGCPDYSVVYDSDILHKPVRGADPQLFQILGDYLSLKIAELPPKDDIVAEVRWHLRRALPTGAARLAIVAKELRLSSRTLQRRLAERGEVFEALLEQVRLQILSEISQTRRMSNNIISVELGFSNPSAFYRWRTKHRQTDSESSKADSRSGEKRPIR